MEEHEAVVIGSFKSQDDADSMIKRLKKEGYQREDITLYTSSENIATLNKREDVKIDTDSNIEQAGRVEDDWSFWEQLKDKFTIKPYDYDDLIKDNQYKRETDLLYPYQEEITSGNIVIVVENYRGDHETPII